MKAGMRGLYAITPDDQDSVRLRDRVTEAIAGGARVVQYRNKTANAALKREQMRLLLPCCREAGVLLIVNDDLELARECGADGLHLGREDGALAAARALLGPDCLLGASCYNRIELARRAKAEGADYVAFGSVFGSSTKPDAVRAPLHLFREARELALPLVAIGGITPENAREAIEAGADALAIISALFDASDVRAAAQRFSDLFKE